MGGWKMFWTGRWEIYCILRQKAVKCSSEKVDSRKALCCSSWLSPSLLWENYHHQPLPCKSPFTFQTIVGSIIKQCRCMLGEEMLNAGAADQATARTYNTVYIRERHPCLQIGRSSQQGTELGSGGWWQHLFPLSHELEPTAQLWAAALALQYPDPHLLFPQTPMPGGITICGDWFIPVLPLPNNSI